MQLGAQISNECFNQVLSLATASDRGKTSFDCWFHQQRKGLESLCIHMLSTSQHPFVTASSSPACRRQTRHSGWQLWQLWPLAPPQLAPLLGMLVKMMPFAVKLTKIKPKSKIEPTCRIDLTSSPRAAVSGDFSGPPLQPPQPVAPPGPAMPLHASLAPWRHSRGQLSKDLVANSQDQVFQSMNASIRSLKTME